MFQRLIASYRLSTLISVGAAANVFLFVTYSAVTVYTGSSVVETFSYLVNDTPWMPTAELQDSILGIHHFGDFKIWLGYASVDNPYSESVQFPPASPALSVYFFRVLLSLGGLFGNPLAAAFVAFLVVQISFAVFTMRRIVREFGVQIDFLAWAVLSLTAPGVFVVFDRGGSHILSGCLALNYLLSVNQGRSRSAFLWLVCAVALKPYFVVCILHRFARGEMRLALRESVSVGIANLAPFLLFADPVYSLKRWTDALFAHEFGGRSLHNSISLYSALERLGLVGNSDAVFQFGAQLTARLVAIIFLSFVVIVLRSCPISSLRILVIMACSSFLVPLSYWYTTAWIAISLPLVLHALSQSGAMGRLVRTGTQSFCAGLACQIVFMPFHIGGISRLSIANPLSQILLLTGIALLSFAFVKHSSTGSRRGAELFRSGGALDNPLPTETLP